MSRALLALWVALPAMADGLDPAANVVTSSKADAGVEALKALVELPVAVTAGPSWLSIAGVKVLPEELYRTVLTLAPDAGADPDTADQVREQLTRFLRSSGYELAHVDVSLPGDGGMNVFIDEGQLEKVVFSGRLTVQTVRFKLALDIPHDVFNRPDLERQVRQLEQELGLKGIRLVLMPARSVKHVGPQLERVPEVKGFEILHELRAYELQIVLPDREWDVGLGADLRIGYIDGVELQGNYQGRSGLFIDDRWRIVAAAAAGLRKHIVTDAFYGHFTRAAFDGQYYFPALLGQLRPALQARANLVSRLRKDLNLVDYYASELSMGAWLEWEPSPGIRMQVGGGFLDRRIFWLLPATDSENYPLAKGIGPSAGSRPFAGLRLDFTFDPENPRWDRRHLLQLELQQQLPGIGAGPFAWTRVYYRFLQPFGWHDLWLRANAYVAWYESTFHDEISLGEFLHGAFGSDFVRRAASVNAEFRFSVTRDVFKLSVQSEVALYTAVERDLDRGPIQFAASLGPGLHLLLEGMFQLDVYVTFGLRRSSDPFAFSTSVNLLKAF